VSFTPQILILVAGLTVITLVAYWHKYRTLKALKGQRLLAVMHVVVFICGSYGTHYSLTAQKTTALQSATGPTLKVATFNKLHTNEDYQKIADYIKSKDLDLIAFEETSKEQLEAISERAGYEHHVSSTEKNSGFNTTVGIMSHYKLENVSSTKLNQGYNILRAEVTVPGNHTIAFYAAHLTPPFSGTKYQQGKSDIRVYANMIFRDPLPVIAGGDFNTTIYSPKLKEFNATVAKYNKPITTERRPGCSWYGYGPVTCLRIDHIYIPNKAKLIKTEISPDLGSDHRLVSAEIEL
jgi:endonuclease/exonuclease/phosphatase (EEP) superfamily protein YafD